MSNCIMDGVAEVMYVANIKKLLGFYEIQIGGVCV